MYEIEEIEEIEEHLAPLLGVGTSSFFDESNSDDDSCVEITSIIDENENELIKWTNYLQLNSDSDENSDEDHLTTESVTLVGYSSSEPSSDDENFSQSSHQPASSNNHNSIDVTSASSSTIVKKRKRRQWTVVEKLHAVSCFENNNNKQLTAKKMGCATKQLRMWIKNKDELLELSPRKKGE
jgi:hypothetical protein